MCGYTLTDILYMYSIVYVLCACNLKRAVRAQITEHMNTNSTKGANCEVCSPVNVFPPLYLKFRTASSSWSLVVKLLSCHSVRGSLLYWVRPEIFFERTDFKVNLLYWFNMLVFFCIVLVQQSYYRTDQKFTVLHFTLLQPLQSQRKRKNDVLRLFFRKWGMTTVLCMLGMEEQMKECEKYEQWI